MSMGIGFGKSGFEGNGIESASGQGEKILEVVRGGLERFTRGLRDASRLDKSLSLVWG